MLEACETIGNFFFKEKSSFKQVCGSGTSLRDYKLLVGCKALSADHTDLAVLAGSVRRNRRRESSLAVNTIHTWRLQGSSWNSKKSTSDSVSAQVLSWEHYLNKLAAISKLHVLCSSWISCFPIHGQQQPVKSWLAEWAENSSQSVSIENSLPLSIKIEHRPGIFKRLFSLLTAKAMDP